MFGKLDTTIIRVRDIKKSQEWYNEKLGFKTAYFDNPMKLAVLDTGDNTTITIWEIEPYNTIVHASANGCYPIFSVKDANKVRIELMKKDVHVKSLSANDNFITFQFYDLDLNLLEACELAEIKFGFLKNI